MRRIIKPFTVQKRNSGRKSVGPAWPREAEQSAAQEPAPPQGTALADQGEVEPQRPAGRVLPALDEVVAETLLPPQRRSRKRAAKALKAEPMPMDQAVGDLDPEPVSDLPENPIEVEVAAAAPIAVRRAARLPREDFRRSERWKARLPAAAHRAGRKRVGSNRSVTS